MIEFSVVIPVYDRERLVLRALRSCLAQTGAEFEVVSEQGDRVERLGFTYRRDDGRLSPFPPLRDAIEDHPAHLRRMDDSVLFDFLQCTRRATFERVRAREWRFAGDRLYLADFATTYRTYLSSEVLGLVHLDARDRASRRARNHACAREVAADPAEETDAILSRHGDAMRRYAPKMLRRSQRARASYDFLAGSTARGARQCLRCLRDSPLSADAWGQLLFGLAGPRIFARIRSLRSAAT